MIEERTTLEIIAPSVEEAIAKGLSDLGLSENDVEVEILDSGSKGIFGLRSRQARVRLTVKEADQDIEEENLVDDIEPSKSDAKVEKESNFVQGKTAAEGLEEDEDEEEEELYENDYAETVPSNEDYTLKVARETVLDLLEKMKVHARVTTKFGEASDEDAERPVLVDIHGNDLSILIGRRSETLNALQYIASLIVGKELEKWIPLQVDVEGYRFRRERMLKQLAHRMADQAISTGRKQVLEPMPANERRVIHMELHEHPDVVTESIGEEPNRKVTINLRNR